MAPFSDVLTVRIGWDRVGGVEGRDRAHRVEQQSSDGESDWAAGKKIHHYI
ncbi:MAG: hypothetical protein MRJ68_22345 [Nitrospira sp.]|jgi:hypothetical protein|nr:hypothetical protein [Nitrospira sp.]